MEDVLAYIENHYEEVEAEYQQVLIYADELRQYWEEKNKERFARIATLPPPPGREAAWAKLQVQKAKLAQT